MKPKFAVVGHVNRGKSSIVSTLAADDSVRIDPMPGTTTECREFPMRVGDETLYTLVDTPGFERPRQALSWLKEQETTTEHRRRTVEQFVRTFASDNQFAQECKLLRPILDGAAILYIVDSSKPPSPKYEAEMEILRWTGQPRIALLNSIDEDDYRDRWRAILDQYFNVVREFDAHTADFHKRIRLLSMLREMSDEGREALDRAIAVLSEDRATCLRESAAATADMLVEMLTLTKQQRLAVDTDAERFKEDLGTTYYDALRKREVRGHKTIREIFLHPRLDVSEKALAIVEEDLFAVGTWNRLGLSRGKLTAAGATAGAVAGGVIDATVGGASFLLGALIGGAVGGAASWYAAGKLPQARLLGLPMGGRLLRIGPMTNRQFPWIVLDRALLYVDVVSELAHARRDVVELSEPGEGQGIVADLPKEIHTCLETLFARLRKKWNVESEKDALRGELTNEIDSVVRKRHSLPAAP